MFREDLLDGQLASNVCESRPTLFPNAAPMQTRIQHTGAMGGVRMPRRRRLWDWSQTCIPKFLVPTTIVPPLSGLGLSAGPGAVRGVWGGPSRNGPMRAHRICHGAMRRGHGIGEGRRGGVIYIYIYNLIYVDSNYQRSKIFINLITFTRNDT